MKNIFFTPGPSQIYPTVRKHLNRALAEDIGSISHRSKKFEEIFSQTSANFRKLLLIPDNFHVFFLSSGTEAMERIIENCVEKESLHFVNGSFSKRFYTTAVELKKEPKKIEADLGKGFDFSDTVIPDSAELVCFTHNETSTGVILPLEEIYKLKKKNQDKLFALDVVSSAPYPGLNFDFLDLVFFSVQKSFGLPAGLGVIILNPKAMEKSKKLQEKGINIGSYHSFPSLLKYAEKNQTAETPPVLHIYLLGKIAKDFLDIGMENIRKETEGKSKLVYDFLDKHKTWKAFVKDKKFRSPTVIVAQIGENAPKVKKYLEEKNLVVGSGYGENKNTQIRIANFPAVSVKDIKQLLTHLRNYN